MEIDQHGGECCGASHIFNFGRWSSEAERELVRIRDRRLEYWEEDEDRLPSHLFEVVLTDQQLCDDNRAWVVALKRCGFRFVTRWYNSNSGNYCNMFVWNRAARTRKPWKD